MLNNGVTLKLAFGLFKIIGNGIFALRIATMAVTLAVCEIFSVNEWHELEN